LSGAGRLRVDFVRAEGALPFVGSRVGEKVQADHGEFKKRQEISAHAPPQSRRLDSAEVRESPGPAVQPSLRTGRALSFAGYGTELLGKRRLTAMSLSSRFSFLDVRKPAREIKA